jgi:small subunit ribosomal protein S1
MEDEAKQGEEKEAKKQDAAAKKAVKNIQEKVEKSTLGDIDALAQLKEQMEKKEKK